MLKDKAATSSTLATVTLGSTVTTRRVVSIWYCLSSVPHEIEELLHSFSSSFEVICYI